MELHSLNDKLHPNTKKFRAEYDDQYLSNHVVQRFLSKESNYQLFIKAMCFLTEESWEELDQSFRQFYTEIRFINYISKVLWRYGRDYRIKNQHNRARYLFILDQPIKTNGQPSTITYKDRLAEPKESSTSKEDSLLDQVENVQLKNALKKLTGKQLEVLDSYYVHNLKQEEIANNLGVSQQAVSKIMKTSLDKLRSQYEKEEKRHVCL
jgi:RNA polymerase sigma factor (sigma-70 family)